ALRGAVSRSLAAMTPSSGAYSALKVGSGRSSGGIAVPHSRTNLPRSPPQFDGRDFGLANKKGLPAAEMVDSAIAKRWRKLSGNVFRAPMRGASERQIDRAGAV